MVRRSPRKLHKAHLVVRQPGPRRERFMDPDLVAEGAVREAEGVEGDPRCFLSRGEEVVAVREAEWGLVDFPLLLHLLLHRPTIATTIMLALKCVFLEHDWRFVFLGCCWVLRKMYCFFSR
jgi:hypothetical protein